MTERRPDLADLDILVEVARVGSIGRAAATRGLTQPSVSRRMDALERALGVPLLMRTRRGSALTPAGRAVVEWAETLLGCADEFSHSVATLQEQRSSAVRAAISVTIAEHHAPRWLRLLHDDHPELTVSVAVHNSTHVADLIEAGSADIGFVEAPSVRDTLHRRRVGSDRLVVAVSPEHPWAEPGVRVDAATVARTPMLLREPGSGTRETYDAALWAHGLVSTVGTVMGSNAALRSAAVAGVAPVVLSKLALGYELESGRLVEVQVEGLSLLRPLTAVWRRGEELAGGAQALFAVALRAS